MADAAREVEEPGDKVLKTADAPARFKSDVWKHAHTVRFKV